MMIKSLFILKIKLEFFYKNSILFLKNIQQLLKKFFWRKMVVREDRRGKNFRLIIYKRIQYFFESLLKIYFTIFNNIFQNIIVKTFRNVENIKLQHKSDRVIILKTFFFKQSKYLNMKKIGKDILSISISS